MYNKVKEICHQDKFVKTKRKKNVVFGQHKTIALRYIVLVTLVYARRFSNYPLTVPSPKFTQLGKIALGP